MISTLLKKSKFRAKRYLLIALKKSLKIYFKSVVRNKKFSIISNDCWGGEIYKILDRPFNTPFIGLMLMSPCYLKLLNNPEYYLNLQLHFKKESKYPLIQEIQRNSNFPIGTLGESEIEIQFLHYSSTQIASEKWIRRLKRMDWENLFIKYDCSKDYATKKDVESLIAMNYKHVLIFGKENYGLQKVFVTSKYSQDAVKQFRNCFINFNPVGWLIGREYLRGAIDSTISKAAYKYL